MSSVERVLIVGGGITGLTLACGLARQGIETLVIDISGEVSGSGIGFWGYAVRALDLVGLREAVTAVGAVADHIELCDEKGNVRLAYDNPRPWGGEYPPELVMARPALADVLKAEAIRRGAEIRLGLTVEQYVESDDGAYVTLTDGSRERWDLVVAADGAYSSMRRLIFGIDAVPELTGIGVWRALVPVTKLTEQPRVYYGEHNHLFLYQAGQGMVYAGIGERVLQPKRNAEEARAHLRGVLEPFTAPAVEELKDLIQSGAIEPSYRPISWLLLPPPWYRAHAILIGDAAHSASPNLSSGGGMGVEDAGVLSELIAEDLPLEQLMERFMQRRWPRASRVWNDSRTVSDQPREPEHWNGASTVVNDALEFLSSLP